MSVTDGMSWNSDIAPGNKSFGRTEHISHFQDSQQFRRINGKSAYIMHRMMQSTGHFTTSNGNRGNKRLSRPYHQTSTRLKETAIQLHGASCHRHQLLFLQGEVMEIWKVLCFSGDSPLPVGGQGPQAPIYSAPLTTTIFMGPFSWAQHSARPCI